MVGKAKDVKKTVQLDEDELAEVNRAMMALDAGFSEVTRACYQVGLPLLLDRPALIKIIGGLPSANHREESR